MIEKFLLKANNINRSAYIWNTASGILTACQSVVLLIVIARTAGVNDAGTFSIAWAISHLCLTLGKFGMRNYQVTDINEEYSINEYFSSRIATCFAMMLLCLIFIFYGLAFNSYTYKKCAIIFVICTTLMFNAISDVIGGWYQQRNRLDVAAKVEVIRTIIPTIVFVVVMLLTYRLLLSSVVMLIVNCILSIFCWNKTIYYFGLIGRIKFTRRIRNLLTKCLPLCAVSFLTIYIGNAPKYAIDAYWGEEVQAYYNYIFMPVFSVGLLAGFVFNPTISALGSYYLEGKLKAIKRLYYRQIIVVFVITIIAVVVAKTIGIPILSWIYDTNLDKYENELCLLMIGGGVLALTYLYNIILTTFRKQHILLIGYVTVAIFAKVSSTFFVKPYGVTGAAVLYTTTLLLLTLLLFIVTTITIKKIETTQSGVS